MSAEVIVFATQKGGVGKTTLVTNTAGVLASLNKRVLVIDTDIQANASQFYLGENVVEHLHVLNSIVAILDDEYDPEPSEAVQETGKSNIFLVPALPTYMEQFSLPRQYFSKHPELQYCIRDFIDEVAEAFDYILIDTRPDLYTLPTWASLLAAHYLVSPVDPERYSLQSGETTLERFRAASEKNRRLAFLGFIVNMMDYERTRPVELIEQFREHHRHRVFEKELKKLDTVGTATVLGESVQEYRPRSPSAYHFREVVLELLARSQTIDELLVDERIWPKETPKLSTLPARLQGILTQTSRSRSNDLKSRALANA